MLLGKEKSYEATYHSDKLCVNLGYLGISLPLLYTFHSGVGVYQGNHPVFIPHDGCSPRNFSAFGDRESLHVGSSVSYHIRHAGMKWKSQGV